MEKHKRKTVAQVARDLLLNSEEYDYTNHVAWGNLDLLHDIYKKAGLKIKNEHPLNQHQAVLNALDSHCKSKNPLFRKWYYKVWVGNRETLARAFTLIEKESK